MARRRQKRRTHVPDAARQNPAPQNAVNAKTPVHASMARTPKTMVIRAGAGQVGPSVTSLTRDLRRVMEPFTASRLQERRSNKLKDYVTMAGPLGVTQLLLFSRSEGGNTNLRILRTPRGPTLHFRILNYSLCKDVLKSQKRPHGASGKEYLNPPLLVMNNFMTNKGDERPHNHEMLATSMFQSLFPAISAQKTQLNSIRRVLLLNRDLSEVTDGELKDAEKPFTVDLRHYSISTRSVGVPNTIRRLNRAVSGATSRKKQKKDNFPNLGGLQDISDFMLDPAAAGYTSESELDTDAEVEVASAATITAAPRRATTVKKPSQSSNGTAADEKNGESTVHTEKKAIKLHEMGPRIRLQLVKIDEGANEGKVLWHSFFKKTKAEERELDVRAKERKELKDKRKKEQNENVNRKMEEKEAKKIAKQKKKADEASEKDGKDGEADDDAEEDEPMRDDAIWSGDEDIWSDVDGEEEDEDEEEEEEEEEEEDENKEDIEMEDE